MFRVLKPGGLFLLADFEHHDQESVRGIIGGNWLGFEKHQVEIWLTQSGFHLKSLEKFAVSRGLQIHLFAAQK